jgi:DEAD/DEAH box helicase domain-containing protein
MAECISQKKIEQATTTTAAITKGKDTRKKSEEPSMAPKILKTPKHQQQSVSVSDEHHLVTALRRIDPLLQFLTRATGLSSVPLATLRAALPAGYVNSDSGLPELARHLRELVARGILHSCQLSTTSSTGDQYESSSSSSSSSFAWDSTDTGIGFPPLLTCNVTAATAAVTPETEHSGGPTKQRLKGAGMGSLHGSTKTAAKRRLAALKRSLKQDLEVSALSSTSTKHPQQEQQDVTVTTSTTSDPDDSHHHHHHVGSRQPKELDSDSCGLDPSNNNSNNDGAAEKAWSGGPTEWEQQDPKQISEPVLEEERRARDAIQEVFGFTANDDNVNGGEKKQSSSSSSQPVMPLDRNSLPTRILPKQVSYAGSHPAQDSVYIELHDDIQKQIPPALLRIFGLQSQLEPSGSNKGSSGSGSGTNSGGGTGRKLYRHQTAAIQAALTNEHVSICTGTGSGKSLCFLLPVLTAAYTSDRTSLILFPTKALAQDQFSKLQALLQTDADLAERIRPATLDGDCPHSKRVDIAERSNVILTNPDTLHAAILPAWRTLYGSMLARLKFVVVDEAHMYEGVFGAHVAMILSRLVRVNQAAASKQGESPLSLPVFVATSATLPWPEQHFRRLCPISSDATVRVLTSKEDGSPRSEKHFFVWNPPILNSDDTCTGIVSFPRPKKAPEGDKKSTPGSASEVVGQKRPRDELPSSSDRVMPVASKATTLAAVGDGQAAVVPRAKRKQAHQKQEGGVKFHRRHAADETAMLLARAVVNGVRCIAFCKTRNLVEWVYERALTYLQNNPKTAHLASKVESYRGGYSMIERRQIEKRLFQDELRKFCRAVHLIPFNDALKSSFIVHTSSWCGWNKCSGAWC